MPDRHFNGNYVSYWKERVDKPMDGSRVADERILDFYIRQLGIVEKDKVLDLGCGYGRLYPLLSRYSQRIVGADISYDMLAAAAEFSYDCLFEASAENTRAADGFFNHIVVWGVYDVVDQEKSLVEFNRILNKGGRLLITGKNYSYDPMDEPAFIAERNAKLKNFPNHFTDTAAFKRMIKWFGFKIHKAFAFQNRGDLGENRYVDISDNHLDLFYEFVIILEKSHQPLPDPPQFSHEFSNVAKLRSMAAGYENIVDFFSWHQATAVS